MGLRRASSCAAGAITSRCSAPSATTDYCPAQLDLLRPPRPASPGAQPTTASARRSATRSTRRHQALLPDYVWGDGDPAGVQQRAAEEMIATVRAAQKLGAGVVSGFTGSPIWSYVAGYPAPAAGRRSTTAFRDFARRWNPILDACREAGVRFAFEVHPGQIAFDLYRAEMRARRARRPRGVRLHLRPEPPALAGRRSRSSSCAASPTASITSTSRTWR